MSFVPLYDLESLTEPQRQEYVRNVCLHMGVPPELNLVMLTYLDENDGPRRLVAYAKRGATEIIRANRQINVTELTSKEIGGSIVFTATGKDSTGRQEMSTGSKWIKDLTGRELDDAIMTSQTRACRRMTLQFVGAGVLDESEVNPNQSVQLKETKFAAVAAAPQPTVEPSAVAGKDVTQEVVKAVVNPITEQTTLPHQTLEEFSKKQEQLRQEAIAQMNSARPVTANEPEQGAVDTGQGLSPALTETKPAKRKYTRKPRTVDLGPSVVPSTATMTAPPSQPTVVFQAPVTFPTVGSPTTVIVPAHVGTHVELVPATPTKPRLSPEQLKPFRQRQFKLVNELEENGFQPKEGMGNQDKMRAFAGLLFPEVTNFNELTIEQWEKYLSTVENKLKTVGPQQTITYIEEAIGI
jgi:hypothetical protein